MAENEDARKVDDIQTFMEDMSEKAYSVMNMSELATRLLLYQLSKDTRYQRSWAKRGLVGYWTGAIGRQIDRVDENFLRVVNSGRIEYAKELDVLHVLDTLTDVGLYSLMGICLIAAYFPEYFKTFMERVEAEING